jgi:hypothetical protein
MVVSVLRAAAQCRSPAPKDANDGRSRQVAFAARDFTSGASGGILRAQDSHDPRWRVRLPPV